MRITKATFILAILTIASLISSCEKDEEELNKVSVTEASWYFDTWKEKNADGILQLSQNTLWFSSNSNLQYYGSLKWYDAGDDGADVFFGHNTAGGYFQGLEGGNSIPNAYHINHDGEMLSVSLYDYSSQSETVVGLYTRESSSPITGNWERSDGASYLKFSGSTISLCNGSSFEEFQGVYNSTTNEATLTQGSTKLDFEIYPEGNDKILIKQYVSGNHLGSTYYYSTTKYPCDNGGGGGAPKTKVIFWNSEGYHSSWGWQVCIDGSGFPNCDAGGGSVVNGLASNYPSNCIDYNGGVEVSPGSHTYDIAGQNRSWAIQSFTISEGQCLIVDVGESE